MFRSVCVSCAARAHNRAANNVTRAYSSLSKNEPTMQPLGKTYTRGRMHVFVNVSGGYVLRFFCYFAKLNPPVWTTRLLQSSRYRHARMRPLDDTRVIRSSKFSICLSRVEQGTRNTRTYICIYFAYIYLYPSSDIWRVQHGLTSEPRTSAKLFNQKSAEARLGGGVISV